MAPGLRLCRPPRGGFPPGPRWFCRRWLSPLLTMEQADGKSLVEWHIRPQSLISARNAALGPAPWGEENPPQNRRHRNLPTLWGRKQAMAHCASATTATRWIPPSSIDGLLAAVQNVPAARSSAAMGTPARPACAGGSRRNASFRRAPGQCSFTGSAGVATNSTAETRPTRSVC